MRDAERDSSNIEETYRDTVLADLRRAYARHELEDEKLEGGADSYEQHINVWDSCLRGRPDTVRLVEQTVRTHEFEVVIVTSNPQGTADILRGCRRMNICAHGPIWDS